MHKSYSRRAIAYIEKLKVFHLLTCIAYIAKNSAVHTEPIYPDPKFLQNEEPRMLASTDILSIEVTNWGSMVYFLCS